jgi:CheY-like chemotaxis protein
LNSVTADPMVEQVRATAALTYCHARMFPHERVPACCEIPHAGLGLTICKKLIEIMGGKMWVQSSTRSESRGSQFFFTLPYLQADDEETKVDSPLDSVPKRPRLRRQRSGGMILLAEDDTVSRKVATRMLQIAGFEVMPARDGAEAVSLFEQHRSKIDLILMDVMMPKMDGLEATERIREMERVSQSSEMVPICALSAGAMKGDRERGLEVGMNDYLYKPINRQQLLRTLEKYQEGSTLMSGKIQF